MAGDDAVEVELHRGILAQGSTFDAQVLVAHTLAYLGQCLWFGHLLVTGLRAEAPQVEQRLYREVEGAITLLGKVLAQADQLEHVRRQGQALAGR
ncbi:hypothetical protein D3C76_1379300 [compost metagenome]